MKRSSFVRFAGYDNKTYTAWIVRRANGMVEIRYNVTLSNDDKRLTSAYLPKAEFSRRCAYI